MYYCLISLLLFVNGIKPTGATALKPFDVKFVDVLYFITNDLVSYLLEEYLQIAYKPDALYSIRIHVHFLICT